MDNYENKLPYSVNLWGSPPDAGNDDSCYEMGLEVQS